MPRYEGTVTTHWSVESDNELTTDEIREFVIDEGHFHVGGESWELDFVELEDRQKYGRIEVGFDTDERNDFAFSSTELDDDPHVEFPVGTPSVAATVDGEVRNVVCIVAIHKMSRGVAARGLHPAEALSLARRRQDPPRLAFYDTDRRMAYTSAHEAARVAKAMLYLDAALPADVLRAWPCKEALADIPPGESRTFLSFSNGRPITWEGPKKGGSDG